MGEKGVMSHKLRFIKASGLALVSLAIWTAVTLVRILSNTTTINDWGNWTMLLVVSFTSSALFGSAVTLAIDAHSQKMHPRGVVLSDDYDSDEEEKCTCTGAYGDGVGRCIKHGKA